ncbi:MAG: GspE/PulE family protein [Phycisphaerae bacterium]|nr:GspE/PulE family protein [Phycisphaerae bacterium]
MAKKKIGEFLVEKGLVSWNALHAALNAQKHTPQKLGGLLVKQGGLDESRLTAALGEYFGLEVLSQDDMELTADVLRAIPKPVAMKHGVIPVALGSRNDLRVACVSPVSRAAQENLRRLTGKRICPALMGQAEFDELFERAYVEHAEAVETAPVGTVADADDPISLVDGLIRKAIARRASDIHLEPQDAAFGVRYRVDGVLRKATQLPPAVAPAVISRLKVLAAMDISDRRTPQDGAFVFHPENADGPPINIRLSTLPCCHGEKAVLRLLPPQDAVIGMADLGMGQEMLKIFREILLVPHGIIIVTGPTGSGKSTTLYSVLNMLRNDAFNITSIEDPIELKMSGINQVQVDTANKVSFAGALRSILRQDPDIIMVGEIRDAETAHLALRAALTGHLVLTSLHTNDSLSAFTRLLDMGCEPFLLASSIRAVLAQRLVRKICPHCGGQNPADPAELELLGISPDSGGKLHSPGGCFHCQNTGFRGRTGLFELLTIDEQLRSLVSRGANPVELRQYAERKTMRMLGDDGVAKVLEGVTTAGEVLKATMGY